MGYNEVMRFEVPQFIEVEDKIFGPFTWKQFIYLAGGAGIALVLYLSVPLIVFALIGIPIAALAGFLAFHQVNNRPFAQFLESLFSYFTNNKLYLWRKDHEQTVRDESARDIPIMTGVEPPTSRESLASLSRKLTQETLEHDQRAEQNHAD